MELNEARGTTIWVDDHAYELTYNYSRRRYEALPVEKTDKPLDRLTAKELARIDEMIAALEAENARLREALKPFADLMGKVHDSKADEYPIYGTVGLDGVEHSITVGDLRRAVAEVNTTTNRS